MNAAALEAFLARLYTDDALRQAFLEQPDRVAREAGLDDATRHGVLRIDRDGLLLAARCVAHKVAHTRAAHGRPRLRGGLADRLRGWLGG